MIGVGSILVAVLAAAPQVGLVRRSMPGVSEETIAVVLGQTTQALERESIDSRILSATCPGDANCLASLARDSKFAAAVGVTIARGRKDLTVDLEAIDGQAQRLAVQTFTVPAKGEPFPAEASDFFHGLKVALAHSDTPRVVELEPRSPPDADPVQVRPANRLLVVSGVTTVATGAIGFGLLIGGGVLKSQLDGRLATRPITGITRTQAESQSSLANSLTTVSIVALAVAGAAAIASGVIWFQKPDPEVDPSH